MQTWPAKNLSSDSTSFCRRTHANFPFIYFFIYASRVTIYLESWFSAIISILAYVIVLGRFLFALWSPLSLSFSSKFSRLWLHRLYIADCTFRTPSVYPSSSCRTWSSTADVPLLAVALLESVTSCLPGQMASSPDVSAKVETELVLAPNWSLYTWTLDSWLLAVKDLISFYWHACHR